MAQLYIARRAARTWRGGRVPWFDAAWLGGAAAGVGDVPAAVGVGLGGAGHGRSPAGGESGREEGRGRRAGPRTGAERVLSWPKASGDGGMRLTGGWRL